MYICIYVYVYLYIYIYIHASALYNTSEEGGDSLGPAWRHEDNAYASDICMPAYALPSESRHTRSEATRVVTANCT